MKKSNNKGVTLIALVITIIVLIILAGISIGIAIGENGLATKAIQAKAETIVAQEKEFVNLAYVGVSMDPDGVVSQEIFQNELDNYTGEGKTVVSDNADNTFSVLYVETGHIYIVARDGIKPIYHKRLSDSISEMDYGKPINYSVEVNGIVYDNWRILVKDEGNVYLILAGCLDASSMPSDYHVKTDPVNYPYYVWSSRDDGSYMNAYVKSEAIWSPFAAGCEGATAVGGPSLRQISLNLGREVQLASSGGYSNLTDDLFVIGTGYWLNGYHYYYASDYMYRVTASGIVTASDDGAQTKGFSIRPVVCLPADATGIIAGTILLDKEPVNIEEDVN